MASYKVKLICEDHGIDTTIDCDSTKYILDAAEDAQIDLPYSCRAEVGPTLAGLSKIPPIYRGLIL